VGLYRRKKSENWWMSYQKDGRQRRESTGTTNKNLAKKLLSLRNAQVLEQRWSLPRSNSPRLGAFLRQFLHSIPHKKTRDRYQQSVNNILRYYPEGVRLPEITTESVFNFQQKRMEEGVSNATNNRDYATLSSALTRARKMRFISHNPCSDVERLNERRGRRQAKPLSYDEEARVKRLSPPWLSILITLLAITLLAETGLRVRIEALRLRWSDLFLDSDPACLQVRDSKSAAGLRTVWLTKHCKDALLVWRSKMGSDFSPYVFPSPRIAGAPISDYKTAWRSAAKKAGLADRRIYDLRATFASRANSCSASGLTVAHLLGHASTQILATYVKPIDENTKAVIEALGVARSTDSQRGTIQ
jgi:integrase